MKKRVRILVSLLMISGSFTVTSKSYAESRLERSIIGAGIVCAGTGVFAGSFGALNKAITLLSINRAVKIGRVVMTRQSRDEKGLLMKGAFATGAVCLLATSFMASASYAAEIVENPALALENNESFYLLVESVGTELALSSMEQIAKGEDPETVMNSLASLVEQNSNSEEDNFLDLGNEEDIEAQ